MADVLPDDFDLALIGDGSTLPAETLRTLRELVWRKCERDRLYFVENFWFILNAETFAWELFKLRDYQHEDGLWIVEAMRGKRLRKLVLKARQIGWTTLATALTFHDAFFNQNHPWLIASQTEDDAKDTLRDRIKTPYGMLPLWMRERGPQVTDQNLERMSFDNGSWILSIPATSRAGRSKVVYGVLLDEFAFTGTEAEGLLGALDPLCYGPMVVFSTAFGMGNPFHTLWVESQKHDSEWDARFRPWNVVPNRSKEWYEREKRKYRGRLWQFYQEYPSNPEEAFAKTGRTALPVDLLRAEQEWTAPKWRVDLQLVDLEQPSFSKDALIDDEEEHDHELWIWERPTVERDEQGRAIREPNYVIACDVAEGLEHGDRTSITVMDANNWHTVATYLGFWPVEDLADLLFWLGELYHWALIGPERNNHGLVPIDRLRRLQYPRLYRMDFIGQIVSSDRTPRYGWHTNRATKPKMVNDFVKGLREGVLVLHDGRFLAESTTFISDGKGSYGASAGNHDDHVMSQLIAWQLCLDVGSYPTVFFDDSPFRLTFGHIQAVEYMNQFAPSGLDTPIGHPKRIQPTHSFFV